MPERILPNLARLGVTSPADHPASDFLEFLIQNRVNANPDCANHPPLPGPQPGARRSRVDMTADVECSSDGFLMKIDIPPPVADGALSQFYHSLVPGGGWTRLTLLGTPERRLQAIQSLPRAREVFGHPKMCELKHEGINIDTRYFDPKTKAPLSVAQIRERDQYASTLIGSVDYVWIHPTNLSFAFATAVRSAAAARSHPWGADDEQNGGYLYLDLVCSVAREGESGLGKIAVGAVVDLAQQLGFRKIVMSALDHVVWFYHDKAGARFVQRPDGAVVDIPQRFVGEWPRSQRQVALARRKTAEAPLPARRGGRV